MAKKSKESENSLSAVADNIAADMLKYRGAEGRVKIVHATTVGEVTWDERAACIESAPNPEPPSDDPAWVMTGSVMTEVRFSRSTILWFWRRVVRNENP